MITEERYHELVGVCNNARILYMQGAYTGVSDELYDSYMMDIRDYEKYHHADPNSPTQSVNPNLGDGDVKHPYAMLSLLDVFTKEDAYAFMQKFTGAKTDYTLEYKLDGLSVQLIYRDGKLVSASTRGDGLVGVECLESARYIDSIPKTIEPKCEVVVRGEVFMRKSRFEDYCKKYGKQANPRNTAVGIFKRKSEIERAAFLSFKAFNLENYAQISEEGGWEYHTLCLEALAHWGFDIVTYWIIDDKDCLYNVIDEVYENREEDDVPIDGMVLKVNLKTLQETLGDNGRIPHWAVAYKFPAKEQETKLRAIEWNVGATGDITPVGILDPVLVMGSTISRATLHNLQRVKDLDVQVGDMVVVYKAGDIIPAIKSARHTEDSVPTEFPKSCPACGAELVGDRCLNIQCKQKILARLEGWMDKKVANFKGVGTSIVTALFERGKLDTPADFYKIKPIEIMTLPGSGRAKMNTFMQRVAESKTAMSLTQVLVGLGINDLAQAGATKVEQYMRQYYPGNTFQSVLNGFLSMSCTAIQSILGKAKGESVYKQLQEPYIQEVVKSIGEVFADRTL
jgi:DNA ligase (NAD+)